MLVNIKYFASVREAVGRADEIRETSSLSLAALRDELVASGAAFECLSRNRPVRMALNHVMSDEAALLIPNCEVAFFPPVTGG